LPRNIRSKERAATIRNGASSNPRGCTKGVSDEAGLLYAPPITNLRPRRKVSNQAAFRVGARKAAASAPDAGMPNLVP
jgi:hypothetical protein